MGPAQHNNHSEHHAHMNHGGASPPHGHAEHDHHKMMIEDFKKRFWISLVVTIPVLILSEMIQLFFRFHLSLAINEFKYSNSSDKRSTFKKKNSLKSGKEILNIG